MFNIETRVYLDEQGLRQRRARAKDHAQFALDNQVLKDSNFFIPKREAYLDASGVLHSRIGKGHIEWKTPYARRLYYNPQYNFSKDVNPHAQGLWFEAAKATHKPGWVELIQRTYDENF
jgi:hypothetical protein